MRCKSCDYPLWNIKARQCPECGNPFRLSEFEFTPSAVDFLCPFCSHPHSGNAEFGRIEPVDFSCAGCGVRIHFDHMVVQPIGNEIARIEHMPWIERRSIGFLKGFWQTIGLALVRPARLIRTVPAAASVGESLVFGMIVMLMVIMLGLVLPLLVAGWFGRGMVPMFAFYFAFLLGQGIVGMMAMLLIWPMLAHLALRLTGGCRFTLDRTIHAFSYGSGANIVSAVPCVGPYVGWIWWLISSILMLRQAQRVSGWRATFAVLALPLSIIVIVSVFAFAVTQWSSRMGGMMAGGGPPGGWGGPGRQTWIITTQIQQNSWNPNSQLPVHAIELVTGNSMLLTQWNAGMVGTPQPFCNPSTKTTPKDIPVGDGTLSDFLKASQSSQFKLSAKLIDQLPPNTVAHRMGDFVFTIPSTTGPVDPNAWVVVMLPDPDVNGTPQPGDPVYIGQGDGTVTATTFGQLPGLLNQQNQYRAANGMPTLPDLATVTHAQPGASDSQQEQ
jgi:hypothetical protein